MCKCAGSSPLPILALSPIFKGKDRLDCDTISGTPGMTKLRLGIDMGTGKLCVCEEAHHLPPPYLTRYCQNAKDNEGGTMPIGQVPNSNSNKLTGEAAAGEG